MGSSYKRYLFFYYYYSHFFPTSSLVTSILLFLLFSFRFTPFLFYYLYCFCSDISRILDTLVYNTWTSIIYWIWGFYLSFWPLINRLAIHLFMFTLDSFTFISFPSRLLFSFLFHREWDGWGVADKNQISMRKKRNKK